MRRSAQRGLTMIEILVVIVILGMFAAFAVPRYVGRQSQARVRAVTGMTATVRSAANMAHGIWIATGNITPIAVDGKNVNMVNGYPDAAGIRELIQDTTGFVITVAAKSATFSPDGARSGARCSIQYTQAPDMDNPFGLAAPLPAALNAGC